MVGNSVVGLGSGGSIWYTATTVDHKPHDMQLVLRDAEKHQQRGVYMSSRRLGYMPTVFLLALVLAYPMSRSRLLRALLWSVAWIHVWIVLVLVLYPFAYGDLQAALTDESPSAGLGALQYVLEWVLSGSSAGWLLVPLLIWTLTCFRKSDWTQFIKMVQPDPPSAKS